MAYKTRNNVKWFLIAVDGSTQVYREECNSYFQLEDKRNKLLADHPTWNVSFYYDLS